MLDQVTDLLSNTVITDVSHIRSDIGLQLGENRLWVDSPWRIETEGRIVIGNDNLIELLEHEDYKFDHAEAVAFIKAKLKGTKVINVSYSNFNELTLELSNGCTFRSFQTFGTEENDVENFQLTLAEKRYLVYPNKVELLDL